MVSSAWQGGFVRGSPNLGRCLGGLGDPQGGAVAVLAPCAKDSALRVTPMARSSAAFTRALKAGRAQGALRGRIVHGSGRIAPGRPMVVVAAVARSRSDAIVAVESMLNALKGVATRRDE